MSKLITTPEPAQPLTAWKPNDVYYTVMAQTGVLDAAGNHGYHVFGPIPDLATASNVAQAHPGSLLAVTTILHQSQAAPPPADLAATPKPAARRQ